MDLIHLGSRSLVLLFRLRCMTQPSHANPHRIFWHCFSRLSETLRKPLETQGNPHSCSGNPEVTPLNAFTHPLRPYKAFTPASRVSFLGADASTSAQYWTEATHTQPLSTLSGQDSLTRALKTSCHLELKIRCLPSPLLTSRHLWDSNPRGETPSAQQADALTARPKCLLPEEASQLHSSPGSHVTVSLCFLCPLTSPSHPLSPTHENNVHQPEIESGSHRWQRCILPLDH